MDNRLTATWATGRMAIFSARPIKQTRDTPFATWASILATKVTKTHTLFIRVLFFFFFLDIKIRQSQSVLTFFIQYRVASTSSVPVGFEFCTCILTQWNIVRYAENYLTLRPPSPHAPLALLLPLFHDTNDMLRTLLLYERPPRVLSACLCCRKLLARMGWRVWEGMSG